MDIISVLMSSIHANMQEYTFEINSVLAEPTKPESLDRLEEAVKKFSHAEMQINVLKRLSEQVQSREQEEKTSQQ